MESNRENRQSHLTHLTDAQFGDLLLGTASAAAKAHLEACAQCSEEADRVSGAIGSFEQQSLLWAERRAASRPLLAPHRQPVLSWLHIPANPQAWTAAVLAIALAAGIGVAVRNDISARKDHLQAMQPQLAEVQPAPSVSPSTLKADNELLSAIDGELRADTSTPVAMYGLTATSRSARARAPKRIAN
jgi:hypothetical protein